MTTGQIHAALNQLCGNGLAREGMTDGQLLQGFIAQREEAAFEALVSRHGPMVLGVCRRLLGNSQDAEDAFQATFLVLVRKASSVVPRDAVGNWLYGVAYRTSLEARARMIRRRAKEKQVKDMPETPTESPSDGQELRAILDRELCRLPDRYRLPIVLCELEGRSRKEVARQLQLPEGTLSSRLAAGRKMLARRLARHAPALSAGTLTVLLSRNGASASVPTPLMSCTIKAAIVSAAGDSAAADVVSANVAALTEGVVKSMFLTKLKFVSVVLVCVAFLGAGTLSWQRTWAADGKDPKPTRAEKKRLVKPAAVPAAVNAQDEKAVKVQDEKKDDGQQNQKDDGQKNQKDDGQQNQKDDGQKSEGSVKSIDIVKNTITVLVTKKGKQVEEVLNVREDVPVVVDGKPMAFARLTPGTRVGLDLSKDRKDVLRIKSVMVKEVVQEKNENAQQNQNDDGQKNQKDDGQKNQKDDGQKNQENQGTKGNGDQ